MKLTVDRPMRRGRSTTRRRSEPGGRGGKRPYLSIVVPCHNEAEGLRELQRRTVAVLDALNPFSELVLVDDGSADGTWAVTTALASVDARIVGVRLSRNFGQQAAITAGLAMLGLLAGVSFLSGAQMLMLGILGAYVGRLYVESRARPLFIVSEVVTGTGDGCANRFDAQAESAQATTAPAGADIS